VSGAHPARHPIGRTPTAAGLGEPGGRKAECAFVLHDPRSTVWRSRSGIKGRAGSPLPANSLGLGGVPLTGAQFAGITPVCSSLAARGAPFLGTERARDAPRSRMPLARDRKEAMFPVQRAQVRKSTETPKLPINRRPPLCRRSACIILLQRQRSRAGARRPGPIECPPAKSDRFKRTHSTGCN
jgi:hypothetical protein